MGPSERSQQAAGRVGYVLPVNYEEGGLFEAVLIVGVYGTEEAAGDRVREVIHGAKQAALPRITTHRPGE